MGSLISACNEGQLSGDYVSMTSIPVEIVGKINPYADSVDAIAKGKVNYDGTCSSCHGNTGLGDGPASASLTPPPPNLVELNKTAGDDFLFWRISEGLDGTPMVAWKTIFSADQIWQVVSYIRTFE